MSHIIPAGNYLIQSVAFPSRVVDLRQSQPASPLIGFRRNSPITPNQIWHIRPQGSGQYTLQARTPAFATATNPQSGSTIVGSPTGTNFFIFPASSGITNLFTISVNGLLWTLSSGTEGTNIMLRPPGLPAGTQQWTLELVSA